VDKLITLASSLGSGHGETILAAEAANSNILLAGSLGAAAVFTLGYATRRPGWFWTGLALLTPTSTILLFTELGLSYSISLALVLAATSVLVPLGIARQKSIANTNSAASNGTPPVMHSGTESELSTPEARRFDREPTPVVTRNPSSPLVKFWRSDGLHRLAALCTVLAALVAIAALILQILQ
jgi:hypothetical protein